MWPTPTFPDDLIISVPLLKSNEKNCDGSLEAGSTGINSDGSTGRNGNFVFYMKKGGAEAMWISKKKWQELEARVAGLEERERINCEIVIRHRKLKKHPINRVPQKDVKED